ncbi:glycerol-3-phosphate dehydrogenase [Enemella dayhoffiae]|uniref:Glycerol-3-phosphate dehydrogenase n=2 Tax=Enemella dayhoffiae TaxID=2016507 RepID=A0A255H9A5_9ACTN|nr:glycerol-3-phosphate dehydrogenase [Enemella dayhoffiae]
MSDEEGLDVLVVGGGVTGAGIALDAATRGLRTGIVEMQDWAQGTSSRSSKLVHGGLRYLYNLDFALVHEALRERGLLLSTTAPHLVKEQPFLWPLKMPVIERSYSAVGVGLYDVMARAGAQGHPVPVQRHYTRKGALEAFPDIRPDQLTGAIRYFDARVDDARLVLGLVRTAVGYGAYAASRTQVVDFPRNDRGRVTGAVVRDLETGTEHTIRASRVINSTGVWTEDSEELASRDHTQSGEGLKVLASKGIHLVFPKERINGSTGLFLRTEKSVLFIIPWQRYWIVGTTDTAWHHSRQYPVATTADIDYILEHANKVLSSNLTREDVIGTYAGLRPLVQPTEDTAGDGETSSTKVSREHTVAEVAPGLVVIAGGKLTTYRAMAEDAVDYALGSQMAKALPSVTARTPLVGAAGLEAASRRFANQAGEFGWTEDRVEHLLGRYGTEVAVLLELIAEHPEWAEPLPSAPAYLKVEAAFAVLHEGALHLADILNHRIRLGFETRDRGVSALEDLSEVVAPLLGWDVETVQQEQQAYAAAAAAEAAAEAQPDDASAEAARLRALPVAVG